MVMCFTFRRCSGSAGELSWRDFGVKSRDEKIHGRWQNRCSQTEDPMLDHGSCIPSEHKTGAEHHILEAAGPWSAHHSSLLKCECCLHKTETAKLSCLQTTSVKEETISQTVDEGSQSSRSQYFKCCIAGNWTSSPLIFSSNDMEGSCWLLNSESLKTRMSSESESY